MLNRRSREMGLGSLKAVSLASAREKAAHCRSLLADGVDPIEARKTERETTRLPQVKSITFKEAADAYIAAHEPGWKNAKHASQWRNTLKTYAFPISGSLSVSDFDTSIVMQILRPVWTSKPETTSRLRGRIERILDWSSVSGFRSKGFYVHSDIYIFERLYSGGFSSNLNLILNGRARGLNQSILGKLLNTHFHVLVFGFLNITLDLCQGATE